MMTSPIGPLTKTWLEKLHIKEDVINTWNGDTALLQDLGWGGDDAIDNLNVMRDEFGVDFSKFDDFKYFESELSFKLLVITLFRNSSLARRISSSYPRITMDMLETALSEKKWFFD
jgi:hypothetical protein